MSKVEFWQPVVIGFAAPVEDTADRSLDLNELLVKKPNATYFVRVAGKGMTKMGIHAGDILVVNRSAKLKGKQVIVAFMDGEFVVRQVQKRGDKLYLCSGRYQDSVRELTRDENFEIWGVVTSIVRVLT